MPTVITYWQLPQDECNFLDFLDTTGEVFAVRSWARSEHELVPLPIRQVIIDGANDVYIGLKNHTESWLIEPKEDGKSFGINNMRPCLISCSRGKIREGNQLTQTNLCAYFDYPTSDRSGMLRKPADFVRWAKQVFAWVKDFTPERVECNGYRYPATRTTSGMVTAGMITPVLY